MNTSESFQKTVNLDGYRRLIKLEIEAVGTDGNNFVAKIVCNKAVLSEVVVDIFHQVFIFDINDRKRRELRELNEEETLELLKYYEGKLLNEYIPQLLGGSDLRIPDEWQTSLSYDENTKTATLKVHDAYSPGHKRSFFTKDNLQKIIGSQPSLNPAN